MNTENNKTSSPGKLYLVSIGPGAADHMTPAALKAVKNSDYLIGYKTYLKIISGIIENQQVITTGMTEELQRANLAIEKAKEGYSVSLISSGDVGVYGMASLVLELLHKSNWQKNESPQLAIIPGITAANACSSLIGAPLGHDYCVISLSDLLTPWSAIVRKIEAAAQADFVITLYNPASTKRKTQIMEARDIILKYRKQETPVCLIKSAYRKNQTIILTDLESFLENKIGMLTTIIIGNSQTFTHEDYMITPRGYADKYSLKD